MNEQQFNMNSNYEQRINIKQEMNEQQLNGEGEPKKKKKKKPFDPYRPKKQLSKVWTAFRDSPEGAYCNYCGALRKRNDSSTKSLWEHLKQKHQDVLKTLKGETDGQTQSTSTQNAPVTTTSSNLGADLQNMCSSLLQGNTYDTSNSFNIMATLNATPNHQLFTSSSLPGGVLTSNSVASANDSHGGHASGGSVLDILTANSGHGVRQGGNVFTAPVGRPMQGRQILIPQSQSQSQIIVVVRWRIEPVLQKDAMGIGFVIRGIRTDNNNNYTSTELQKEVGNATYRTVTGDLIQLNGIPLEGENKDLFRSGFPVPNWRHFAFQHLSRLFK